MKHQCITVRAPAKLNLGLEVTGKRSDGYHELVTIIQAVDLYDSFVYQPGESAFEYASPPNIAPDNDLVRRAFSHAADWDSWAGRLDLRKNIPLASGLGGGSSDAAVALQLALPDLSAAVLRQQAANLGADVPFFLDGGTALARGIGDNLTPLRTPDLWFVILTPDIPIHNKTARMFHQLEASDFSDGATVAGLAAQFQAGLGIYGNCKNAFEEPMRAFPQVSQAWTAFKELGLANIQLSGAGPSVYTILDAGSEAHQVADDLAQRGWHPRVARSISQGLDRAAIQTVAAALRPQNRAIG